MIYSNDTVWWSFTTQVPMPGAFNKSSPANSASGQASTLNLSWVPSPSATGYEYCFDTTNDNACNSAWFNNGTSTTANISGLLTATTYYWQVRASNPAGVPLANPGAWWSFTVDHHPVIPVKKTFLPWVSR